jgi:hypothetical protein
LELIRGTENLELRALELICGIEDDLECRE